MAGPSSGVRPRRVLRRLAMEQEENRRNRSPRKSPLLAKRLGVVGRKTGVQLLHTPRKDEDALDDVFDFFAACAPFQPAARAATAEKSPLRSPKKTPVKDMKSAASPRTPLQPKPAAASSSAGTVRMDLTPVEEDLLLADATVVRALRLPSPAVRSAAFLDDPSLDELANAPVAALLAQFAAPPPSPGASELCLSPIGSKELGLAAETEENCTPPLENDEPIAAESVLERRRVAFAVPSPVPPMAAPFGEEFASGFAVESSFAASSLMSDADSDTEGVDGILGRLRAHLGLDEDEEENLPQNGVAFEDGMAAGATLLDTSLDAELARLASPILATRTARTLQQDPVDQFLLDAAPAGRPAAGRKLAKTGAVAVGKKKTASKKDGGAVQAKKRSNRGNGVVVRRHEQPTVWVPERVGEVPNGTPGTRRSGRQRIKPLKFWKNEHVVYESWAGRETADCPRISMVVRAVRGDKFSSSS